MVMTIFVGRLREAHWGCFTLRATTDYSGLDGI
jgi:hypothetical protein